jgi:hypothetical protein
VPLRGRRDTDSGPLSGLLRRPSSPCFSSLSSLPSLSSLSNVPLMSSCVKFAQSSSVVALTEMHKLSSFRCAASWMHTNQVL